MLMPISETTMLRTTFRSLRFTAVAAALLFLHAGAGFDRAAGPADRILPPGAKVVWDLDKAQRDKTFTRERVCLNGLWRWQPATEKAERVPADKWGYFKVP